MGAWGSGPFDNDSALDFLGDLAHEFSVVDDGGGITSGTVDHAQVSASLRTALEDLVATDEDGREHELAYAAAGLVAAALAGVSVNSSGTRLGDALEAHAAGGELTTLGLDAHCGYLALLKAEDARTLTEPARHAVAALASDAAWLDTWRSDIRPQLAALDAALV